MLFFYLEKLSPINVLELNNTAIGLDMLKLNKTCMNKLVFKYMMHNINASEQFNLLYLLMHLVSNKLQYTGEVSQSNLSAKWDTYPHSLRT